MNVRAPHETFPAAGGALFVVPNKRGDGFRASIRGHLFELADPDSAHGLVPTPEDLLGAAIASDVAWCARRFLRAHGLDDYVSVEARVRRSETAPETGEVDVTVEVSSEAVATGSTLATVLERRLAANTSLAPRLSVRRI